MYQFLSIDILIGMMCVTKWCFGFLLNEYLNSILLFVLLNRSDYGLKIFKGSINKIYPKPLDTF